MTNDDATRILQQCALNIENSIDKSKHGVDFMEIINAANAGVNIKKLVAVWIHQFFKHFPELSDSALDAYVHLVACEDRDVRVDAIKVLPTYCIDTPKNIERVVHILVQNLGSGNYLERDLVHTALMDLLHQNVKASLIALFNPISVSVDDPKLDEVIRIELIDFVQSKVFPKKDDLFKPQNEMERHITDLIKEALEDVTCKEFETFMGLLMGLSLFGENAPAEHMQELVVIIERQVDLDSPFDVGDTDRMDRLISCLPLALPSVKRGASIMKLLDFICSNIDKLPREQKLEILRIFTELSANIIAKDSEKVIPYIVQLLKQCASCTVDDISFTYVECLLYIFHCLAPKVPSETNSLCGYKLHTGQPSDGAEEDSSEHYNDFTKSLEMIDKLAKERIMKLPSMAVDNRAESTTSWNNIEMLKKPLLSKSPSFVIPEKIKLSWTSSGIKRRNVSVKRSRIFSVALTDVVRGSRTSGGGQDGTIVASEVEPGPPQKWRKRSWGGKII